MSHGLPSRAKVVRTLADAGRALHTREIATRLVVSEGWYPKLLELLERLHFEGAVRRLAGSRYQARSDAQPDGWEGLLSVHPRGFGFVAAAGHEDVYVAREGIGGALHGDCVRISIVGRSARGTEGNVESIVERRSPRVAGVLRKHGRSLWLEPDDGRLRGPVVITKGGELALDGQAAVVSITRFPSFAEESPEAELIMVLGSPGDPAVEVSKILAREGLTAEYPAGAIDEAKAAVQRVRASSSKGRADLRSIPLLTVDPADARDHDDAIWAESLPDGYRAWVAIADVAEFVRRDTELDQEAYRRGCSVYLPARTLPMLPRELSAEACSLVPGQDRLCLYIVAELDPRARVRKFELGQGLMCSAASLTYGDVAQALGWAGQGSQCRGGADRLRIGLLAADEIARKLRRRRLRRGALELEVGEAEVVLAPDSLWPEDVRRRAQEPGLRRAYQLIEELMLLANELVARWLEERQAPTVYRVHGEPDPSKLERLGQIAERLGVPFDPEDMLAPSQISHWVRQLRGHPRRGVLEMLLLRTLKQAHYDVRNVGHFGLASDSYLHFTSPIRRYPDLLVHAAVRAVLRGEPVDRSEASLERLRAGATQASARERAAVEVEREVIDLYRALLMRERIGACFEGTVSGLASHGVYVVLDRPFVDVLVPLDGLGQDLFEPIVDENVVVGKRSGEQIQIGDRMLVSIQDVSIVRRLVVGRRVLNGATPRKRPRKRRPADKVGKQGSGKRVESGADSRAGSRKAPSFGGGPRSGGGERHCKRGDRRSSAKRVGTARRSAELGKGTRGRNGRPPRVAALTPGTR